MCAFFSLCSVKYFNLEQSTQKVGVIWRNFFFQTCKVSKSVVGKEEEGVG